MFDTIMTTVIPVVATIVLGFVLHLVNFLIKKIAAKYNLDWLEGYEAKVDALITTGVQAVEKLSLNAVKLGREPTPGEAKLQAVLDFVNTQLQAYNLPTKAADELAMLVESKLFSSLSAVPDPVVTPPAPVPAPAPVEAPEILK